MSVLAVEFPLTPKALHTRLQKEFGQSISYQAVHKSLNELLEQKILEKTFKGYQYSRNWIAQMKDFTEKLEQTYVDQRHNLLEAQNSPIRLTFKTFSEVGQFVIHNLVNGQLNRQNRENLCLWTHAWPMIGLTDKDYDAILEGLKKSKHYCLIEKTTYLDKLFGDGLAKMGKMTKIGVKNLGNGDMIIEGDYITQYYWPTELRKQWENLYQKVKIGQELPINKFFEDILNYKTEIPVLIFKNPELADSLRKETLKLFKTKN